LDATTASYTTAEESKLAGIESSADVTDTTNVTAAGALMDSEVDADIKTLSLPASTTITAAAATVLDDATVAAMVNTLGGATSTGTGGLARKTSPAFVTPTLGVFSATTGSTIGTLTLADGSITDSNGSINFGNETLSTTGPVRIGSTDALYDAQTKLQIVGVSGMPVMVDTLDSNADDLVVFNGLGCGLSLIGGNASVVIIALGDKDNSDVCKLQYNNSTEVFSLTSNSLNVFNVDSSRNTTFNKRILTDDTTEATTTTDGSLQTDGGLSVVKNAVIGGTLGSGSHTITATSTLLTLIESDAAADEGRWAFSGGSDGFNGVLNLTAVDDAGSLGQGVLSVRRTGTAIDSVRISNGRLLILDDTEATTTTDGSLQTAGGLSVVKDAVIGGNCEADTYSVGGTAGLASFNGAVTSITVVNGIVTAAS
jgi:hypothetical protein